MVLTTLNSRKILILNFLKNSWKFGFSKWFLTFMEFWFYLSCAHATCLSSQLRSGVKISLSLKSIINWSRNEKILKCEFLYEFWSFSSIFSWNWRDFLTNLIFFTSCQLFYYCSGIIISFSIIYQFFSSIQSCQQ